MSKSSRLVVSETISDSLVSPENSSFNTSNLRRSWKLAVVGLVVAAAVGAPNLNNLLTGMPEGLVLPNPPTLSQKLQHGIRRLLSGVETTVEAAPPRPIVMPSPPPGATTFDFDGDGKADIGRWHNANTEFKVKNSYDDTYTPTTIGATAARAVGVRF